MATEKDEKKKPAAKPAAAKAADKPAPKAAAKAAAPAGDKAAKVTKPAKKVTVSSGPPCRVEGCKQASRAKGYCRKHFMAWRRGGDVGLAHRYKTCSKEGCRKKRVYGGLCEEHSGKAAPAAEASAPAPAA